VQHWKFKPAYQDGKPVESSTSATINFQLLKSGAQAAIAGPAQSRPAVVNAIVETQARQAGQGQVIYRVEGTSGPALVEPPILVQKTEPEYSQEARKAKFQGTVVLYVIVGKDGRTKTIKVLRSLGLGLDEKAIEAVNQWVFKPATRNGIAVEADTQLAVNFRLLNQ